MTSRTTPSVAKTSGVTIIAKATTDANSVLRIRLEPTRQGLYLNWNTHPGLVYQVQTSPNLNSWSDLGGPRFAAGNVDSIYVGGGNVGYFRVLRVR